MKLKCAGFSNTFFASLLALDFSWETLSKGPIMGRDPAIGGRLILKRNLK